ncbi:hypothetical protein RS130_03555 [Paraglaciecola aquimarina]|uniref:Uncharacterized protein n=1 Tax=Paraglaciecola aquimarina TaxID=1235557 RepID=A0ABU3SSY6_9ALTE|nr:hypothetical protein [Paraglaciecola aquimarina]MDU0353128.1 hypothetical protein [Paraglaciecola aquimarina]
MRLLIFMSLWISQITLVDGKNLRDPTEPKGAASQQEMLNGG